MVSMRRTWVSSVMSAGQTSTSAPSARASAAVTRSCVLFRETNNSLAPSAAKARVIAFPRPLLAPVITAALPDSPFIWRAFRGSFLQSLASAVPGGRRGRDAWSACALHNPHRRASRGFDDSVSAAWSSCSNRQLGGGRPAPIAQRNGLDRLPVQPILPDGAPIPRRRTLVGGTGR